MVKYHELTDGKKLTADFTDLRVLASAQELGEAFKNSDYVFGPAVNKLLMNSTVSHEERTALLVMMLYFAGEQNHLNVVATAADDMADMLIEENRAIGEISSRFNSLHRENEDRDEMIRQTFITG